MRKMKKINGYLVVKFNDRELREWEGTALGKYGVIDAELYTGTLEVDRGAMEYDNADSIEEAVELARGLESELDTEEPEVKVTLIKETDEATEEEEVDAQKMIAGWENTLRGQVASPHYKDVDERTAAHELYGYKAALRDLGLLDREDCYVLPDTFGEAPGPLPKKPEELLSYVCDELCRHHLPEMTQEQLDAVCARCSLERLADKADEAELRIRTKAHRELNGLIADLRDARPGAEAGRLEHEARAYLRALAATGTVTEGESAALTAAIEEARTAQAHTPERTTFEHLHPELKRHRETAQIYTLGLALAAPAPGQRLPGLPQHLQRGPGAGCRPGQPGRGRRSGARLAEGAPRTGRRAGGDVRRELRRQAVSEGGEIMNGLDLFRSPKTAADEIADIVSAQCPPVVPENCDAFSCRECWLAWLTTGEPPKEKGPSDKQTAPGRDSAPYYPPTEAIRKAAERLKDGNMEYTAIALIRAHDGEELPQP